MAIPSDNERNMYGMNVKGSDGKTYYVVYRNPWNKSYLDPAFNSSAGTYDPVYDPTNPGQLDPYNPGAPSASEIDADLQSREMLNGESPLYNSTSNLRNVLPKAANGATAATMPLSTGSVAQQAYPTMGDFQRAYTNKSKEAFPGFYQNNPNFPGTLGGAASGGMANKFIRSAFQTPLDSKSFYASSTLPNWNMRKEDIEYYNKYGGTSPTVQGIGTPTYQGKPIQASGDNYTGQVPLTPQNWGFLNGKASPGSTYKGQYKRDPLKFNTYDTIPQNQSNNDITMRSPGVINGNLA